MSREIKFRAWDKERQEMRQIQLLDWSAWWVSTGSTWERGNSLEYGERNSFKNEETDRHILMQYTGLKDKNDKEIYEGDIVTLPVEPNADLMQAIIEWEFDGWKFKWLKSRVSDIRGKTIEPVFHNIRFFEIIGNIYTNPELLGEDKHE